MLKTSLVSRARYPKPCTWCGDDVKFGPFTYGKVVDTDTQSVMLHGDMKDEDSCAGKFARGQQPLRTNGEPQPIVVKHPDPVKPDYLLLEPADLTKLLNRINELDGIVKSLIHEVQLSLHPANEEPREG